jgi:hypothetical protein
MTATLKKILKGFLAAVTSTEAVKEEKSLLTLILVRLGLSAGAAAALLSVIFGFKI